MLWFIVIALLITLLVLGVAARHYVPQVKPARVVSRRHQQR
jgi:hypothetical protein